MSAVSGSSVPDPIEAFGAPGIAPTFAAGDKDMVSTGLGSSRVWATIGAGVLNEVFWPTTSRPQLRDLGFLVTGTGYWTEVKRTASYTISTPDDAIPLPTIVHQHEHFQLVLQIVCDPDRDAVLIRYRLDGIGAQADPALRLHVLAAPHLGGTGQHNTGWIERGVLHARHDHEHLALIATQPYAATSVGFVGASDGWQDLAQHGEPQWSFDTATDGNIAFFATLADHAGEIALAFATSAPGARTLAAEALSAGYDEVAEQFRAGWAMWASTLPTFSETTPERARLARTSAMVIKAHEDRTFPGAIVASLATPWGAAHDDPGGYHLVWPRDCAETGLALAAIGHGRDARCTAMFLAATQSDDGSWPQNFTPGGEPYWTGHQLDETALPVILAAKLLELGLVAHDHRSMATMVRKAARSLAASAPFTDQDRWEETGGLSPFSLAATIAALAGAASSGWLDRDDAAYAFSLADWFSSRVEELCYVIGAPIDATYGTAGHYERVALASDSGTRGCIVLANRAGQQFEVERLVGLEFLALVRYGLRAPTDQRIVDTVTIVDGELRRDTPGGPLYHRYQDDGYGEHADGSPFDGSGIGRLWPLLTGERGMYAFDLGTDTGPYLDAMLSSTSMANLLPEQVWDSDPIVSRRLAPGRPSGSATPLVWAHAEYLKLLIASTRGVHADRLEAVATRYAHRVDPEIAHVRGEHSLTTAAATLVIEAARPFRLHYGTDEWNSPRDIESVPLGLGRHGAYLRRVDLDPSVKTINWTSFDLVSASWETLDHRITLS